MVLALSFAAAAQVCAQPSVGIPVIGMLCPESCTIGSTRTGAVGAAFLQHLGARGYIDGKTVRIDTRAAGVAYGKLPYYAAELVNRKVAAILTEGVAATEAARRSTSTIPIIMVGVPDAAEVGLIESLSHPGANVTGLTYPYVSLAAKQLQLLRETVPEATRIGVILNPANPEHQRVLPAVASAAQGAGAQLVRTPVRLRAEFAGAMASLKAARVDAVLVLGDQLLYSGELLWHALDQRLPTISLKPSFVEAGGLLSYGPSQVELAERAAFFVDRVVSGIAPAALAAEQPLRFELVVNVTTARALGVELPSSILLRADRIVR